MLTATGGTTWSRPQASPFSQCAGGTLARVSDPWVASHGATTLQIGIAFTGATLSVGARSAVLVSRSGDGGATWSPPIALVDDDGTRIGSGALQRLAKSIPGAPDDHGEIKRVYVVPSARGRGLSRLIMDALVELARAEGCTWPQPETGDVPPRADGPDGLAIADVNLAEINEAFASVPVAACRQLGLDEEITNVNGSGCSLGHPIGCTGARMIVTMLNELERTDSQWGAVAMCAAGGMGSATRIERG